MVDLGLFELKTEVFVALVSVAVFAVQLALCFKVKKLFVRLLPLTLFLALAVCLIILSYVYYEGWDGLGALLCGLYSGLLALVCALTLGFWTVFKKLRAKQAKEGER